MNTNHTTSLRRTLQRRLSCGKRPLPSLRMTAMIDIIFLLLVFFVLTAKFRAPEQFLPIQLPTNNENLPRLDVIEPLAICLFPASEGCRITIGAEIPLAEILVDIDPKAEQMEEFSQSLKAILGRQKRTASDPIEIRCDDQVLWDHLVKVYNLLYAMGVNDITFAMEL
ncbi:MAG: biopolymer transporter ExbD [Sedimentisphaerales bacterium]|nr:biopolymer transporter ExbD [Sedimentisphaerales bacterium]